MACKTTSFFELWRSKKEKGELLERANQLRLHPSQLRRLLGDSGVRAAMQSTRMESLLPPVGTQVFRRLTATSLEKIQQRHKDADNNQIAKEDLPKPASDLEAAKPLPFFYGDPPSELLNTPLEELDPFYQTQKAFMVIGKGNIIFRFNAEPSCYLLSVLSPVRTAAIRILTHSLFRWFMLATILTNCVFMTMSSPPSWTQTAEFVFVPVYTLEAVIKMASRGFCVGRWTFLRDPWNWLDVVVISTACVTEFVYLPVLRIISASTRILKIIPLIPGLKETVRAFIQSVKRLADFLVLMLFCLSVLVLISLQLFMGTLRQKCVMWPVANLDEIHFDFYKYINNASNIYYLPGQLDALLCGNSSDAGVCPEGYTCLRTEVNPNYGFTSYDSFGWSLLSLFRLLTQDFWENLMQLTIRAAGKACLSFFVVAVSPVCFCVLSLFVAMVTMATSEQEEAAVAAAREREEEFSRVVEVLTRREEEEASCRAETAHNGDGPEERGGCPPCCYVLADFLLKWNCCGGWRWLKLRLYAVITNSFFDLGIQICLIINIICIAMEHYPMTERFEETLSYTHLVFTAIFVVEMVVKLVALDPYGYFQVSWNIYDSIIVVFSLLQFTMYVFPRWFVLMRVLRLARWWPCLHMLMKTIWTSVKVLRNLTVLLLIMVFLFCVVGLQLFSQPYKDCICRISVDCMLPRWHMTDFFHSFMVITRVLSGQWIEILWDCMEVSGQTMCLIFFMTVLIIGNLLVLNMFLVLLLSSVCSHRLAALEEKEKENQIRVRRAVGTLLGKKTKPDHTAVDIKEDDKKECLAMTFVTSDQPEVSGYHGNPARKYDEIAIADSTGTPNSEEENEKKKHPVIGQNEDNEDLQGNTPEDCCSDQCYHCCPFLDIDTSQGRARVWSNFRRACLSIAQHKNFEIFIIFIILLSCAALVCEDIHLQQRPVLQMVVQRADQVISFLFLMEMFLKWIAFGLKKYFSDAWCWLDFLILQVSLVSLAADAFGFELTAIQSLRTLRALGPLRALSRFHGLKVVVQTLVRSSPSMFNVVVVFLTVWLVFSLLGVQLFAGQFYYCFNETSEEYFLHEDVNNKTECFYLMMYNFTEVRWKNLKFNFDNVKNGYLSLFLQAASPGSMDVLYAATDARMVESQPVYEYNVYNYLYFICFSIVSSFFTFNFFIRGLVDTLQRQKSADKHLFMTEEQQKHCKVLKKRLMKPPKAFPRPQNRFRAGLYDLVTKPWFEVVMVVLICLNMVAMMVESDQESQQMTEILYWIHFSFIVVFLAEFLLKIIAFARCYFSSGWNVLDFLVLVACIVGMFIADLMEKYFVSPLIFSVFRLARVVRIFSLIRYARGIRKLLLVLMMSLPALFNIGLVLFIVMFTSSLFGMFNFAYMKSGAMIDDMFNFETFGNSMICVFMMSTSVAWDGLLLPLLNTPPDCDPFNEHPGSTVAGDCGSPTVAIVFFITHIIVTFLLVLHMYIAVILETFESEDTEPLRDHDLQMFQKTWSQFDPEDSQVLQYRQLSDFCDALQDPLRIPKPNTIKLIHMDLPLLPGDKIHRADVFLALATQVFGDSGDMDTLKARMEEKFKSSPSKVLCEPISSTLQRKQEDMAAAVIQRAYRKHALQHRDGEEMPVKSVDGGGGV